jgi:hypothetical protein
MVIKGYPWLRREMLNFNGIQKVSAMKRGQLRGTLFGYYKRFNPIKARDFKVMDGGCFNRSATSTPSKLIISAILIS